MPKIDIKSARKELDEMLITVDMLGRYILDIEFEEEGRNRALAYLNERLVTHAINVESALGGKL